MTVKTKVNNVEIKFGLPKKQRELFRKHCELYNYSMAEIMRIWIADWNKVAKDEYVPPEN